MSGERKIAATSFLTFVAMDKDKNPIPVPDVVPETEEEVKLHESAPQRSQMRKARRAESKILASFLTTNDPWEPRAY
jgi:acyl-CoA hydrolase